MANAVYRLTSPLYNTPIQDWYLSYYVHRIILPDQNDTFIESLDKKYRYRPDLLSIDTYQTKDYWWVFASRNMDIIQDPIWDLVDGMSLYLPSQKRIRSV